MEWMIKKKEWMMRTGAERQEDERKIRKEKKKRGRGERRGDKEEEYKEYWKGLTLWGRLTRRSPGGKL